MIARLLLAASLVALAFAPHAAAQGSSIVTMKIETPESLTSTNATTIKGVATLHVDAVTAYSSLNGIPVSYVVTKAPAWATVTVSPAQDVFLMPATPSVTVTSQLPFTVSILASDPGMDAIDQIEIAAVVEPGFGHAAKNAKAAAPVFFDHSDPAETCEDPLVALAIVQGEPAPEEETMVVQDAGASGVAIASPVALGAMALAGGAAGFVMRRRLGR